MRACTALVTAFLLLGCASMQQRTSSSLIPSILAFWHPNKPKTLVVLATVTNRGAFDETVGLHDTFIEYEQIQNPDMRSTLNGNVSSEMHPVQPGDSWYPLMLHPGERAYLLYEFTDAGDTEEARGRSVRVTFRCESQPDPSWSSLHPDPAWSKTLQTRCWRGRLTATGTVVPPIMPTIPGYAISVTSTNTPMGVWRKTLIYSATVDPQAGNW